jgi:nucleoside-diphosphate-sugar epimerase
MNVFVVGGTGYVGVNILRRLVEDGHLPFVLVRHGAESKIVSPLLEAVRVVRGSIHESSSYCDSLASCEAVINLSGVIRESPGRGITFEDAHVKVTDHLLQAAKSAGIRRWVQMSALGVRPGARTSYQATKFQAEELVRASGMDSTIFRPSLIVGRERRGIENFITTLEDLLHSMPFVVPVVGDGRYRFQPIFVDDLAAGFAKSLSHIPSYGKTYDVAGPEQFSFNDLLNIVGEKIGEKKLKLHLPLVLMKCLAGLFGRYEFFPVTSDQITMLEEESISDHWREFYSEFEIQPTLLRTAIGI